MSVTLIPNPVSAPAEAGNPEPVAVPAGRQPGALRRLSLVQLRMALRRPRSVNRPKLPVVRRRRSVS